MGMSEVRLILLTVSTATATVALIELLRWL